MQKTTINCIITIIIFCIPFFLVAECKSIKIRGKRQLDPYIQYSHFVPQYPQNNLSPCINFHVNDRVCPEQYFGPQYFPPPMSVDVQMPGNIMDNLGFSPIWPNWLLLLPQILQQQQQQQQQQYSSYQHFLPYNYQQLIPSPPPVQPTNNEPQTTPPAQTANELNNNLGVFAEGSAPAGANPETSNYSHQFHHVQNHPIHQIVKKTFSSVTNPKAVNIVRTFTVGGETPEVSIREESPAAEDLLQSSVNNPPTVENREEEENSDSRQQSDENQQESQEDVQNIADNKSENSQKEKNRRRQNQPHDDGENEDEYYYEYLH